MSSKKLVLKSQVNFAVNALNLYLFLHLHLTLDRESSQFQTVFIWSVGKPHPTISLGKIKFITRETADGSVQMLHEPSHIRTTFHKQTHTHTHIYTWLSTPSNCIIECVHSNGILKSISMIMLVWHKGGFFYT
jgi:hypothetical protein